MTQIVEIINYVARTGGLDALKALGQGLKCGTGKADKEVELLQKVLSGIFGSGRAANWKKVEEAGIDVTRILGGDFSKAAQSEEKIGKVAENIAAKVKAKPQGVMTEVSTFRVRPPKPKTKTEGKIDKIKELMSEEAKTYEKANTVFRKAQEEHIAKFQEYLDKYSKDLSELVTKYEETGDKQVAKQIEQLQKRAEKTMRDRLQKMGTLKPNEVEKAINDAKAYAQVYGQNVSRAESVIVSKADELMKEVHEGLGLTKEFPAEKIEKMLQAKITKIEQLLKEVEQGKFEIATSTESTAFYIGDAIQAKKALQEFCKGKNPEEVLKHYKEMLIKTEKALADRSTVKSMTNRGYLQQRLNPVQIPVRDAEKSEKLKWFEKQLAEKQKEQAEITNHAKQNVNRMHANKG